MSESSLREVTDLQYLRDVPYPAGVGFRQLLITGPPGSGKSAQIAAIGGWPHEGYVDLSSPGWWRSRALSLRPCEVHLGFPFRGQPVGLALFDDAWLRATPPLQLVLSRVALSPTNGFWGLGDWRRRFVFEFLLPPARTVYEARRARSDRQTHPVDAEVSLGSVEEQLRLYEAVAHHLHRRGITVFVRNAFDGPPMIFGEQLSGAAVRQPPTGGRDSLFSRISAVFGGSKRPAIVDLVAPVQLSRTALRVARTSLPLEFTIEQQRLRLYPEVPLALKRGSDPPSVRLFDPEDYDAGVGGLVRIETGERVRIGEGKKSRIVTSRLPSETGVRLEISFDGESVTLADHESPSRTWVRALRVRGDVDRLTQDREDRLRKIGALYGGPLELLDSEAALATLVQVNEALEEPNPFRPEDGRGRPGGLLELPPGLTPVLIGDLHARIDNLLVVLTEGRYLDLLERGDLCLILLGDAVHPEDGDLAEMDSSILMMDLVLSLMRAFPQRVVYVRGNHDSFSTDIAKAGVPQGRLWRARVSEVRGANYVAEMERFYSLLPYVVATPDFVACHAGPPLDKVSRERIIEIDRYPNLRHQMTWNRVQRAGHPAGYGKREVKAFRKAVGLSGRSPLIVSHQPKQGGETVWMGFENVKKHHVVYSARSDKVGVFTRIRGEMTPLVYPADALSVLLR